MKASEPQPAGKARALLFFCVLEDSTGQSGLRPNRPFGSNLDWYRANKSASGKSKGGIVLWEPGKIRATAQEAACRTHRHVAD